MTPHYSDAWLTIYAGDCREVLPSLPSDSVDCIVTSPPFWGLRDYGHPDQLGLEPTPEQYVANLVSVFRELRRVLKPTGTAWLNLGDSYGHGTSAERQRSQTSEKVSQAQHEAQGGRHGGTAKQLVGIPWRVAFALQADGWYLRSDIIWAKPNPMPESVTDRPTKAHEYLFLLTKSARYFYDADAVREAQALATTERYEYGFKDRYAEPGVTGAIGYRGPAGGQDGYKLNPAGRNLRSVWTIATRPYPGAHFAVFPPELPERCIKAGSSERGVCPECGKPWERVVERTPMVVRPTSKREAWQAEDDHARTQMGGTQIEPATSMTTGWRPSCEHAHIVALDSRGHTLSEYEAPVPAVILDPFAGSGTVGLVANRLSRKAILIDLNAEYIAQQMRRNAQTPLGLSEPA